MPDNPKIRGKADRARVSNQPHEKAFTAKSLGITQTQLAALKRTHGTSRAALTKAAKALKQK